MVAVLSHLKGYLQYANNLRTGIDVSIKSLVVVLIFLTKIHTASQLTNHHEVGTLEQFLLQRRLMQKTVECSYRTYVGEEAQLLAHSQQTRFWTHLCRRVVIIFQVAYSSKQHSVSLHTYLMSHLWIWVTHHLHGVSSYECLFIFELMSVFFSYSIQHGYTLFHNLGTYSIARKNSNFEFHKCSIMFV